MLKAIYKTGSSLILKDYNDIDTIRCYEKEEERKDALKHYKHDSDTNVHFCTTKTMVFLGCYIYHYVELLEGEDLHLNDFSIFDEKVKQKYVPLLKNFTTWLPKKHKWWYHILTACYLYSNGEYKLTDSQLKDIQRTHDKGITESKYKFCIDTLKELS